MPILEVLEFLVSFELGIRVTFASGGGVPEYSAVTTDDVDAMLFRMPVHPECDMRQYNVRKSQASA
jgi:hypothetical protein